MSSINLIDSFSEFKDAENIDRPTLIKVIEDVFKTLLRKKYYSDENFDVIVNDQTGDLEIFQRREQNWSDPEKIPICGKRVHYVISITIGGDFLVNIKNMICLLNNDIDTLWVSAFWGLQIAYRFVRR